MSTVCDTLIPSSGSCGVVALGRCGPCGRAFCWTHAARTWDGLPAAALCAGCAAQEDADRTARIAADGRERETLVERAVATLTDACRWAVQTLTASGRTNYRAAAVQRNRITHDFGRMWVIHLDVGGSDGEGNTDPDRWVGLDETSALWFLPTDGAYPATSEQVRGTGSFLGPRSPVLTLPAHAQPLVLGELYRAEATAEWSRAIGKIEAVARTGQVDY